MPSSSSLPSLVQRVRSLLPHPRREGTPSIVVDVANYWRDLHRVTEYAMRHRASVVLLSTQKSFDWLSKHGSLPDPHALPRGTRWIVLSVPHERRDDASGRAWAAERFDASAQRFELAPSSPSRRPSPRVVYHDTRDGNGSSLCSIRGTGDAASAKAPSHASCEIDDLVLAHIGDASASIDRAGSRAEEGSWRRREAEAGAAAAAVVEVATHDRALSRTIGTTPRIGRAMNALMHATTATVLVGDTVARGAGRKRWVVARGSKAPTSSYPRRRSPSQRRRARKASPRRRATHVRSRGRRRPVSRSARRR